MQGVLAIALAGAIVFMGAPAQAVVTVTTSVPNKSHVVGGITRAKLTGASITWYSDKSTFVKYYAQDTSTDGYCAQVTVNVTYTRYWNGVPYSTSAPARTFASCNGAVNYNDEWYAPFAYCSSMSACEHGVYSYAPADTVTIYIGRTSGDKTSAGTYYNPLF
jgi:hypothetical protein